MSKKQAETATNIVMLQERVKEIEDELNEVLIQRGDEIRLALATLLARGNTVFLGPVGVAKSIAVQLICSHIEEGNYFEYLLTKMTTPDELFGPPDMGAFKEKGIFKRNTRNRLPEANIGFVDETFKGSSAISNTLLFLLVNRKFDDGEKLWKTPIEAMFGASNELPDPDEGLEAFYDRWIGRKQVKDVEDPTDIRRVIDVSRRHGSYSPETVLTLDELHAIQKIVDTVDIETVKKAVVDIHLDLKGKGVVNSLRRLSSAFNYIRAYAFMDGRMDAEKKDLDVLRHVLWQTPDDRAKVDTAVYKISNPYAKQAQLVIDEVEQWNNLLTDLVATDRSKAMEKSKEIFDKLSHQTDELKQLNKDAERQGYGTQEIVDARTAVNNLKEFIRTEVYGISSADLED